MGCEWNTVTLGDIANGKDGAVDGPFGSNLPASCYVDNGIPVIRGSNLSVGLDEFKDNGFVFVSDETFQKLSRSECRAGDIVFTKKGTLGQTALITEEHQFERYLLSSNQMRLRVDPAKAISEYVYYCVSSQKAITKLLKDSECTGVPKINLAYLKSISIPLPRLEEQKRIIGILGSINAKISLNRQINQTLEQMAQTLFKSWFVDFDPVIDNALDAGSPIPEVFEARVERRKAVRESADFKALPDDVRGLFPSEFEESELGWGPKGWSFTKFGDLLDKTIGGDWGKDVPDEKHTEQVKIIRGTDIPDLNAGGISSAPTRWVESKKLKTRKLEHADIVIEVSGGSPKQPTGRSLLITNDVLSRLGGVVEPASFCRRFKPVNEKVGLLASEHLKFIYAAGKMWEYQNQSTGIANFQTKFFLEAEYVMVPNAEVLEHYFSFVMSWIEKRQSSTSIGLEKLRDTLLPKLISGELRLDSSEVEQAKALVD